MTQGSALPQDYAEELTATGRIHGTTDFEEPISERTAELLAQAIRLNHTCRYCDAFVPLESTVCEEHLGQYQQYRKKAKAQAQRLCELAREKRAMVTRVRTSERSGDPACTAGRLANTVTT